LGFDGGRRSPVAVAVRVIYAEPFGQWRWVRGDYGPLSSTLSLKEAGRVGAADGWTTDDDACRVFFFYRVRYMQSEPGSTIMLFWSGPA